VHLGYIVFILDYLVSAFANAFLFYLPIMIANAFPCLLFYIIGYEIPIDLGKKFGKEHIFGKRTIGGFLSFLIVGIIVGSMMGKTIEAIYLSSGAFFGVLSNSFIKRRIGIKEGEDFIPFDQVDYILGATLFYIIGYGINNFDVLILIFGGVISFVMHTSGNYLLKKLKKRLKKKIRGY